MLANSSTGSALAPLVEPRALNPGCPASTGIHWSTPSRGAGLPDARGGQHRVPEQLCDRPTSRCCSNPAQDANHRSPTGAETVLVKLGIRSRVENVPGVAAQCLELVDRPLTAPSAPAVRAP
jgi:hypothetical protein